MKKLLVGSVYGPSERNSQWYKLQLDFLGKTTADFDHAVYLSGADKSLFGQSIILDTVENRWLSTTVDNVTENFCPHIEGVQKIVGYFNTNDYSHCLILDSDCFPITENWMSLLIEKMGKYRYAAPIRYENLETWSHPSFLFIKEKGEVSFIPTKPVKNLLNEDIIDCGCNIPLRDTFPLIRSNKYNPHPIFGGIYWDICYHHCCGSRQPITRSISKGYYAGEQHEEIEKHLFESLVRDPKRYLQKLRCTISV